VFRLTLPRTLGEELAGSPLSLGPDEAEVAAVAEHLVVQPGVSVAGFGLADVDGAGGDGPPAGHGHPAGRRQRGTGNGAPAGNGQSATGNGSQSLAPDDGSLAKRGGDG
jgi:hypothetical protein